jgi:hypothetical protein
MEICLWHHSLDLARFEADYGVGEAEYWASLFTLISNIPCAWRLTMLKLNHTQQWEVSDG